MRKSIHRQQPAGHANSGPRRHEEISHEEHEVCWFFLRDLRGDTQWLVPVSVRRPGALEGKDHDDGISAVLLHPEPRGTPGGDGDGLPPSDLIADDPGPRWPRRY